MNFEFLNAATYTQLVTLYSCAGAFVMYTAWYVLRKFWPGLIIEDVDSDFIAALHAALFTITFLTLGYCLVNASDTADNYQQNVEAEANDIKSLNILLSLYGNHESAILQADLKNYAQSITHDEWPSLAKGRGSDKTLELQRKLRSDLSLLQPTSGRDLVIYAQILETTSKIIQARSTRIANANNNLAPQFMLASNVGYICILLISALMLTQFTWFRFLSLNIQIFAVSFIFASTITLDNPFRGKDSVSAEPISLLLPSNGVAAENQRSEH